MDAREFYDTLPVLDGADNSAVRLAVADAQERAKDVEQGTVMQAVGEALAQHAVEGFYRRETERLQRHLEQS